MIIRRHRGIVAAFAVAVLTIAATSIGLSFWAFHLPKPADCNRDQLQRWLVLRDLRTQPREVTVALVDRFEAELAGGMDVSTTDVRLSDDYLRQLTANIALLKKTWFEDRVSRYFACPPASRMAYLEQQIETIMIWSNIDLSLDAEDTRLSADEQRHAFTVEFFGDVERWIAQADSDRAPRMLQAVRDGILCWLATSDLADEPMPTRRELARRIVRDLNAGFRLDQISLPMDDTQRQRLADNTRLLLEAWLYNEAEEFADLPRERRTEYLDRQLENVSRWGIFDLLTPQPSAADSATTIDWLRFMQTVEGWIAAADAEHQPRLRQLVSAVHQRILWRQMQGLFHGGARDRDPANAGDAETESRLR